MRINKGTYLIIALLLTAVVGKAQLVMSYSMSPIAVSGKAITANGGTPVVMDGTGKCLSVSSGLRSLEVAVNGTGVFAASCAEIAPVAAVAVEITSVNLYPNPTHSTSILKCNGVFDANLSCMVRVIGMDGRMMMSQMVPMKDVQAGYTINASAYAAGTYVVSVDFKDQHYTAKLIKL